MVGCRTAMRAMWSSVSVFSLSLNPYVGAPPKRRRVVSMQAMTVGNVLSRTGTTTRKRLQASHAQNNHVFALFDQRPIGVIPLEPQTRLWQPRPKPPPVASPIRRLGFGDRPPNRALGARIAQAQRLELVLYDVRTDAAVAVVNPAFDVIAKRVDHLIALNRRGLQLARLAPPYISGDGVVRAPRQLGCVSKTMRQIVGRQDLHNRLGLL